MAEANSTEHSNEDDDAINVELMLRVKKGDHDAFEKLVEKYQNAVVGTVAKMLGNNAEAEDIAQQVFIRLWKSAPRYQVKAKFTTFLFTITRNLVFNETKRKSRKKEHSLEEQEENTFSTFEDTTSASPKEEILQHELQCKVDEAIAALPEKQRMAVILKRYEGLSYEQIASVLELSVSAVKSQLFRARTELRNTLKQYLD